MECHKDVHFDAETIFDDLVETYNTEFSGDIALNKPLDSLSNYHKPGASVLDVGCGPGGPASYLASQGYDVTGIDVSGKMIEYCKENIPGTFYKTDMLAFTPNGDFDIVIAMFSLYQLSYESTKSMLAKITSWLRPGGTLILATTAAEEVVEDLTLLNESGGYVEKYPTTFIGGKILKDTYISTDGWLKVIQDSGLSVRSSDRHLFHTKSSTKTYNNLYITAQKAEL